MAKGTAVAERHFGRRILKLQGESGLKTSEVLRRVPMSRSTYDRWTRRSTPPGGKTVLIHRLEEVLGGPLWDWAETEQQPRGENAMVMESRLPFMGEPQLPVDNIIAARRILGEALDVAGAGQTGPAEIMEQIALARDQLELATRMLKMKVRRKGK